MGLRTLVILAYVGGASAQLVISPPADEAALAAARARLQSSAHGEVSLTLSEPTICDPDVQQHAGYFQFGQSAKKYFFWFFESRSNPSMDPTVMWLTGGPGCSSQLALLSENGPCRVNEDGKTTKKNPYSWNTKANAMWVDQPPGTGFSVNSESSYDHDQAGVGKDMYAFLQAFFGKFPQYNRDFFVTGESYAGHYVPSVTQAIFEGNKEGWSNTTKIDLKGFAIGNGLTWPEIQNQYYPKMAYNSTTAPAAVTKEVYESMVAAVPQCNKYLKECNEGKSVDGCKNAYEFCNQQLVGPYQQSGMNTYDMRIKCKVPPLCYDFSSVTTFLNDPATQAALGVDNKWASCNMDVNMQFQADFEKNYHMDIPDQLESGIRALIYAGDVDFICNWLGNKAWTLELPWSGKDAFNAAADEAWLLPSGKEAGKLRQAGMFSFLQVYQAGHMVPMDQPEAALYMLNSFLEDVLQPKPSKESIVV